LISEVFMHGAPAFALRAITQALFACVCWLASTGATAAGEAKPMTAILLVARADMPDPNFKDSVVLVMNNIAAAPAGIIVNRPTRISVATLFPDLPHLAGIEDKVYFGGPVDMTSVSFLFRADTVPENAIAVLDGIYLSSNGELLKSLLRRERPMEGLRIYIGYCGWARGQLEAELGRGDWKLAPADATTIFDSKSQRPWPEQDAPGVGRRI
jgi:putative transcriptional regulator